MTEQKLSPGDLYDRAKKRASSYAPRPACEPPTAGAIGAFITFIVVLVFSVLAGFDLDRHGTAQMTTIAIGFLIPFGYFKFQERKYYKAVSKEYEATRQTAGQR